MFSFFYRWVRGIFSFGLFVWFRSMHSSRTFIHKMNTFFLSICWFCFFLVPFVTFGRLFPESTNFTRVRPIVCQQTTHAQCIVNTVPPYINTYYKYINTPALIPSNKFCLFGFVCHRHRIASQLSTNQGKNKDRSRKNTEILFHLVLWALCVFDNLSSERRLYVCSSVFVRVHVLLHPLSSSSFIVSHRAVVFLMLMPSQPNKV